MSENEKIHRIHKTNGFKNLPIEGALEAPVLYFDDAPSIGTGPGISRIVLCAFVQEANADGTVTIRKKAVAHLRGPHIAFGLLKGAITEIERLVMPPEGPAN